MSTPMPAYFCIWCRTCGQETAAVKKHGPLPGTKRCAFAWWNVCCACDTHYIALPPVLRERRRMRLYTRRSGQLSLAVG